MPKDKNEVRKHIRITKELDDKLKEVVKVLNCTESNVIKTAIYCFVKDSIK